ncbi:hypothetical protein Sjap_024807 [Stephania japonica]|uniref:Uncharacterized protein n=1 Tax=Stephania japonica TaxID=461633 RepID=A0AAP0EE13_9MAGN
MTEKMTPNANKRKSFESKHIEERNRVNSRRRQLYAQLTQEEKDRRNYVRRVSYQQKRSLQCIEKGSSSKQDGCVSNERLIDGLQKQRIIERNIGAETWRDEDRKMEEEAIKERAKGVVVEEERVIPSCLRTMACRNKRSFFEDLPTSSPPIFASFASTNPIWIARFVP